MLIRKRHTKWISINRLYVIEENWKQIRRRKQILFWLFCWWVKLCKCIDMSKWTINCSLFVQLKYMYFHSVKCEQIPIISFLNLPIKSDLNIWYKNCRRVVFPEPETKLETSYTRLSVALWLPKHYSLIYSTLIKSTAFTAISR